MTTAALPAPGFADPTRDAQRAFRAILDALARPARPYPVTGPAEPPAVLGPGLAAVALTLLDEDSIVWLGGALGADAEVAAWLAFHTGTRRVADPAAADFVITGPDALPPLASLAMGTDEAPHLSATVVLDVRGYADADADPSATRLTTELATRFSTGFNTRFIAQGPGIDGTAALAAPWAPEGFAAAWQHNTELFPRGVDLLLVDSGTVTGLPRTTRLTVAGTEQED
jgi:alpha-D-ribose 1-methylphosphonate 5-triphosphate synthase subunit PhnH